MRRFSDREKDYISRLCEATRNPRNSFLPINLLNNYLYSIGVGYTTGSDILVFDREVDDVIPSEIIAIENTVIELALLLDYLEKNGLIKYVEDQPAEGGIIIGKRIEGRIHKETAPIVTEQLTKASSYRIVVGETLRDLVINNFKTSEDKTLEAALQQGELAQRSLNEARLQSQNAINALSEAKEQTRLAGESLNESRKQTQNTIDALKESREQTKLAQESLAKTKEQTQNALEATEEARKQTELAQNSLEEARKQTENASDALKEARKQTKKAALNSLWAFVAVIISLISFCLNMCSTNHVIVDECQSCTKTCQPVNQPAKGKDSTAISIKAKEPPVLQQGKIEKKVIR